MPNDQTYWVGQKAFIKKGNDVLVLTNPTEGLDFPGGKIQEGETSLPESLKREVREETSLEIEVKEPFIVWQNTLPSYHKNAGQKVYLVGFICEYLSGEINLSAEHNDFKWVNKENYKKVDDGTRYFEILDRYFQSNL